MSPITSPSPLYLSCVCVCVCVCVFAPEAGTQLISDDHPGFLDDKYRNRRTEIVTVSLTHSLTHSHAIHILKHVPIHILKHIRIYLDICP